MTKKIDFDINWSENILTNSFVNYTYHITLAMVHPENVNELDIEKGIIFSETGATAKYQIESLNFSNIVGWNKSIRSGFATQGTIELYEPLGLTFYDAWFTISNALGIDNPTRAGFILEVRFIGQNADNTNNINTGLPVYRWPILINGVTSIPTEAGTRHVMTFVLTNNSAYDSYNETLTQQITVRGVRTLGEFINKLNQEIESANKTSRKNIDGEELDSFLITFGKGEDEKLKAIDFSKFTFAVEKNDSNEKVAINKTGIGIDVTIQKGSTITDTIAMMYLATTEGQTHVTALKHFGSKTDPPSNNDTDTLELPVFFKIDATVEIGKYDNVRQDNAKHFIYKIIPTYEIGIVYNMIESKKLLSNPTLIRSRINQMLQAKLLTKRYDYFYTGVNTDILGFNFELNNAWFALQPVVRGANNANGFYFGQQKLKPKLVPDQEYSELIKVNKGNSRTGTNTQTPQQSNKSRVTAYKYAEEYFYNEKNNAPIDVPIRYKTVDMDSMPGNLISIGEYNASNLYFSATYANLLGEKSLTTINLDIIGDPFWFGITGNLISDKDDSFKKQLDYSYANFKRGSNLFLLNVPLPKEDYYIAKEEKENDQQIKTNVIKGLYCVTTVYNNFSNGQFTQTLEAYKDSITSSEIEFIIDEVTY